MEADFEDEGSAVKELRLEDALRVTFLVLTYDEAHNFARGKKRWKGIDVEVLVEDIFPTVEEGELIG